MRKVKLDKIEIPDHVTYRCIHCGHIRGEKLYACTDKDGHEFHAKPEKRRIKMDTIEFKKEEPKKEVKKYRGFNVEVVNNGFIATIGCQRLVFRTLIEMADLLKEYWENPNGIEKKYIENSLKSGNTQEFPEGTTLTSYATVPGGVLTSNYGSSVTGVVR